MIASTHGSAPAFRLALLLLVAAIVRLIPALIAASLLPATEAFHFTDTPSYLEPAESLLAGRGFARADGGPEILRTPGYPMLLAVGVATGHLDATVLALQIVLSTLTVLLVYAIALETTGDDRDARAAAWLYTFEPLSILYASRLLTETLFTSVFALFVLLLLRALRSGERWTTATAALALAASAYVRPAGLPLCALVPLLFASAALCRAPRRRRVALALLFLFVAESATLAWTMRNEIRAGYDGFSAIGDQNLYFFKAAGVMARQSHEPFASVQRRLGYEDPSLVLADRPAAGDVSEAERFAHMRAYALETLRAHPVTYASSHVAGMARTALDPGALGLLKLLGVQNADTPDLIREIFVDRGLSGGVVALVREHPMIAAVSVLLALWLLALYALGFVGLLRPDLRRSPRTWLVAGFFLYFLVIAGGPEGTGRYRHPAMPLLCVLAGAGVVALRSRRNGTSG